MSRPNKPKDNAVAERFIKTFKEHKLNGMTIEQWLLNSYNQNPNFRNTRSVLNKFVKSLNSKKNKKSLKTSPQRHDNQLSKTSMLMIEPKYSQSVLNAFRGRF